MICKSLLETGISRKISLTRVPHDHCTCRYFRRKSVQ